VGDVVAKIIKMKVINDLKKETINEAAQQLAQKVAQATTDASHSYTDLKDFVPQHNSQVVPGKKAGEALPWVHIAISNAKRQLLNAFRYIKPEYLQSYLDEFCCKFSRHYLGELLFNRLLVATEAIKVNLGMNTGNHLIFFLFEIRFFLSASLVSVV